MKKVFLIIILVLIVGFGIYYFTNNDLADTSLDASGLSNGLDNSRASEGIPINLKCEVVDTSWLKILDYKLYQRKNTDHYADAVMTFKNTGTEDLSILDAHIDFTFYITRVINSKSEEGIAFYTTKILTQRLNVGKTATQNLSLNLVNISGDHEVIDSTSCKIEVTKNEF